MNIVYQQNFNATKLKEMKLDDERSTFRLNKRKEKFLTCHCFYLDRGTRKGKINYEINVRSLL